MPQITDDYLDAQRESIRGSLDAITNDLGMALRDAGFGHIPIYLVIPNSGDALASLATPLDLPDEEWSRILEIAYRVIQKKIGSGKLRRQALTCAAINAPMTSADVTSKEPHHVQSIIPTLAASNYSD